jgi:hypothetical protein
MWQYMMWKVGHPTDRDGGRVKYLNGEELPNWNNGPGLPSALNQAGADGWELVSVAYWTTGSVSALDDPLYIFKRPTGYRP